MHICDAQPVLHALKLACILLVMLITVFLGTRLYLLEALRLHRAGRDPHELPADTTLPPSNHRATEMRQRWYQAMRTGLLMQQRYTFLVVALALYWLTIGFSVWQWGTLPSIRESSIPVILCCLAVSFAAERAMRRQWLPAATPLVFWLGIVGGTAIIGRGCIEASNITFYIPGFAAALMLANIMLVWRELKNDE